MTNVINRRHVIGLAGAAVTSGALGGVAPGGATPTHSCAIPEGSAGFDPANRYAARAYLYTIVTPDLDASLRFYRDVMGYGLIDQGSLKGSRGYALLRYEGDPVRERGVIRLLAAPRGATANRPRPQSSIVDPGLALLECHPRDARESHDWLAERGVTAISPPKYYSFDAPQLPSNSGNAFCVFGPAGEQLLFNCQNVPNTVDRKREVDYPGRIGPLSQHTLVAWDRWPMFAFYGKLLGLAQAASGLVPFDRLLAQENVATLLGAPSGTYYRAIGLGGNELWEYRQRHPEPQPPWPTSLDRTGLAMVTIAVDDLAPVRSSLTDQGLVPLGVGALPTPEGKSRDAVMLRGPVGELIEVVGRRS